MLLTKAQGRAVMDLTTAETVGTVTACTVAASPARVSGLRLKTRGRGHHVLDWSEMYSFGPDAVTVDGAGRIRDEKNIDPGDPAHSFHDPIGKPVLTETAPRAPCAASISTSGQVASVIC
ncbi:hypothetical protein GCM10010145_33830 [Streptomyces ruber]|uniref:Uncharacterized protein n=2 Tax=Streptomyces TaxID=1883 RepID=A0A918BDJ2_9ACTN|nr:hypothetical protein [Streptomyces ruber]GGQ60932.1 hypothetical protein GCM10010145_33830 [Streptomyces ruber]